jgi:hypothetical protein
MRHPVLGIYQRGRPPRQFVRQHPAQFHGIRIAEKSFVARKFHALGITPRTPADSAVMHLRMVTQQLTGIRVPPRVRNIPNVRRRLTVTVISEPPMVVIVRQRVHNMDTPITKARPVRDQRA